MFYKYLFLLYIILNISNASSNIKNLKSFEAKFYQEITSPSENKIEYKGDVFIRNDGKILWKYKTPILKNVYILNDYAIIDEPELEQAIFTKLENKIDIIKILKNAKKIKDDKYLTVIEDIDYIIEFKNNKVSKISYSDKLDNKVKIKFTNVIQNQKIRDKVFKFKAPEYYDIIRK